MEHLGILYTYSYEIRLVSTFRLKHPGRLDISMWQGKPRSVNIRKIKHDHFFYKYQHISFHIIYIHICLFDALLCSCSEDLELTSLTCPGTKPLGDEWHQFIHRLPSPRSLFTKTSGPTSAAAAISGSWRVGHCV